VLLKNAFVKLKGRVKVTHRVWYLTYEVFVSSGFELVGC